jgi:hypothetical protein
LLRPSARTRPSLPKEYFWREHTCPLSGRVFDSVAVKGSACALRSRGTDFRPYYDGPNPLHYAVLVSPVSFAAEADVFRSPSSMLFRDHEGLVHLLRTQPVHGDFCGVRDLPTVCRAYELALSCTSFLKLPRSEVAGLALRTSWMFQEWGESGNAVAADQAQALRSIAIEHYLDAYEKEDVTRLKLGSGGVAYLIAELLREQRRFDDSLRWFARVVADKSIAAEVLRVARNQMELCRDERQAAKASREYEKPKAERVTERCMYQLYRDQARWLARQAEVGPLPESALLRGVMDGLIESEASLTEFKAEQDIAAWIAGRLKAQT